MAVMIAKICLLLKSSRKSGGRHGRGVRDGFTQVRPALKAGRQGMSRGEQG
jgi:hypothetical protein